MSVAYPATIPLPVADLSVAVTTGLSRFRAESGRIRQSGAVGKVQFAGALAWDLLEAEYSSFTSWWRDSLEAGTLPFELPMDTGGGVLTHVVQMIGLPTFTNKIKGKTARVDIVITDRPNNVSSAWTNNYNTIPALWPTGFIPAPNQAIKDTPAQAFYATSLPPTAASPFVERGRLVNLSFVFRPSELNYFLAWFQACLLFGRKSFIADFPGYGSLEYLLIEDPQIGSIGYNYTCSLTCQSRQSTGTRPGATGWGFNWGNDWGGP